MLNRGFQTILVIHHHRLRWLIRERLSLIRSVSGLSKSSMDRFGSSRIVESLAQFTHLVTLRNINCKPLTEYG